MITRKQRGSFGKLDLLQDHALRLQVYRLVLVYDTDSARDRKKSKSIGKSDMNTYSFIRNELILPCYFAE